MPLVSRIIALTTQRRVVLLFLLLQLGDILTTTVGLRAGAVEQNPFAAWWFTQVGSGLGIPLFKALASAAIVLMLVRIQSQFAAAQLHWNVLWVANVCYGLVVLSNFLTIVNVAG